MRSQRVITVLSVAVVAVAAAGLLDASIGRVWDLAVLFAVLLLVGLGLLWGGPRGVVTLRTDLLGRITRRASRTGEPLEQLTDRAVATFLEALEPPSQDRVGEDPVSPSR